MERRRAAVFRLKPFTIIISDRTVENSSLQPLTLKIDPGSKTTGLALAREIQPAGGAGEPAAKAVGLFELTHRGQQISTKLTQRKNYRRRRRSANLRYRKPRFLNRGSIKKGWLAPSIQHRVDSTVNFVKKLQKLAPITALAVETVRFDTQKLQNPEISGTLYQRGELFGFEVREYLLEKWGRRCAYCGADSAPLQIDHIIPKARGGSDRVSNLTLACPKCSRKKGAQDAGKFLAKKPEILSKILAKAKAPFKDAAAANSARWALWSSQKLLGLPITMGTGGQTKFNRTRFGVPKGHALDALCVGRISGAQNWDRPVLTVKCTGRGRYQRTLPTAHGFPRAFLPMHKKVHGFQTGDLVKAAVPKGKFAGTHVGRAAVRTSGSFDLRTSHGKVTVNHRHCRILQLNDGYEYGWGPNCSEPNSSLG